MCIYKGTIYTKRADTPRQALKDMSRNLVKIVLLLLLATATLPLYANILKRPYSMEGFFLVEDVSNFHGGAKTGSIYNLVYHPIVNYQFDHNDYTPSARVGLLAITNSHNQFQYTYASQSVSNMTAQREIRISELNYFQKLNSSADIRLGIMDIREYFNVYDVPKELVNSAFGTDRVMNNATAPATYPYPGFGVVVNTYKGNYELGFAIFQGNPQHQDTVLRDGAFFLEELSWEAALQSQYKPMLYLKLGSWQYYQPDSAIGFSNIGLYVMGQMVWLNSAQQQINIFAQAGYGPTNKNSLPYSLMAGLTISGLIPGRNADKLCFGASQIWLRNLPSEIVFELNYVIQVTKNIGFKPDLQYIIKPSGIKPNALAGIVRLIYNIDGHLLAKH